MADETLRDQLAAAYDKHEEAATAADVAVEETPAAATTEPTESAPPAAETPPTSQGEASSPAAGASAQAAASPAPSAAPQAAIPAPAPKAPRSWSAEAKAAFATLPEPVKQDVLRREREISQGLERAAPARQHFERFSEVVKPFEPLLQAYNVDAIEATKTLMATRAVLEIGTPEQKAQVVANIIHDFGIDVVGLDNLLAQRGAVQPFRAAEPPRPAPLDPRVEELLAVMQETKAAKAEEAIATVSGLPHFEDVREDMADIVEAFAKNGKSISLEGAYKRALALNPDLEPSSGAPTISKSQAAAILASRNAAGSVSGAPRTGAKAVAEDRRSQIAAAFDAVRAR